MKHNDSFFSGNYLRGEDFSESEEAIWYQEEAEAYSQLGYIDSSAAANAYPYHRQNMLFGFSKLPPLRDLQVCGVGSAHGLEFQPIAELARDFTVIESDVSYHKSELFDKAANYLRPAPDGHFPIKTESIDLLTCFGVLHHICKPSRTICEISRCLRPKGFALIREPIISMGDWRFPRAGLTKNERGIPIGLMRSFAGSVGLRIVHEELINHTLTSAAGKGLRAVGVSSAERLLERLDKFLCGYYSDVRYHRVTLLQKLTPTSAFWVFQKI